MSTLRTRSIGGISGPARNAPGARLRRGAAARAVGRGDARGIPPQPLEPIERPGLRREHVHDDVREVEEDPLAPVVPFDVAGPLAGRLQALDDGIGDRLRLAALRAGADDEAVGEGGDLAEIEGDRVLRLLVGGRLEDEGDFALQLNDRSSPESWCSAPPLAVSASRRAASCTSGQAASSSPRTPSPLAAEMA